MRKTTITFTFIFILAFCSQSLAVEKIFVNYGPHTKDGQDPYKGTTISWQQTFDHMSTLAPFVHWVRTFSCTNGLENVGPIAHSLGMGVLAECWLSKDKARNEVELTALIKLCQRGRADIAIIGSETLYRGDLSGAELISYISRFRQAVPGFPVVVDDTYAELAKNPAVVNASDALMANCYPYWEGVDIMDAAAHLRNSYLGIKKQYPNKLIIIGETGWPSAGKINGNAVPDPLYAAWYFWCVMSWAKTEGIVVFYFEAFDEPWKANYEGSQGSHWGLFDQNGILKQYMEYGFSEYLIPSIYWK